LFNAGDKGNIIAQNICN